MKRLTLDLPPEYLDLCREYGLDPSAVLRGFVVDLCEIQSWIDDPRPDGYASHGSDERDLAWRWFERCGYTQPRI